MTRLFFAAVAATALFSTAAFAHPGVGAHAMGFAAGFGHPFGGLDHILAMTGLGLWAAGYTGRARYALPLAFIVGMIAGGILGMTGVSLPMVEVGIAGSIVAVGVLIALGARLPVMLATVGAFAFAVFHGHAHGTEMAAGASAALYGLGFVAATALLHAVGLAIGIAASHPRLTGAMRTAGAVVAASGVGLLAAS